MTVNASNHNEVKAPIVETVVTQVQTPAVVETQQSAVEVKTDVQFDTSKWLQEKTGGKINAEEELLSFINNTPLILLLLLLLTFNNDVDFIDLYEYVVLHNNDTNIIIVIYQLVLPSLSFYFPLLILEFLYNCINKKLTLTK